MTAHLTKTLARQLAGTSGQPVTTSPRDVQRILPGVALLLFSTTGIKWETYTQGVADFELVIAAGPQDNERKAQEKLDPAYLAIHEAAMELGIGVESVKPVGYKVATGDSQTWPAYQVTLSVPFDYDDLKEQP